jgi:predicted ATPase
LHVRRRPRLCAARRPDALQSLIDKSLVRSLEVVGRARYWMLETIREFAVEQAGRLRARPTR